MTEISNSVGWKIDINGHKRLAEAEMGWNVWNWQNRHIKLWNAVYKVVKGVNSGDNGSTETTIGGEYKDLV